MANESDSELQLRVANELFQEYHHNFQVAQDYLRKCHAIMDEADVPQSLPLHERILWLVRCMNPIVEIHFPEGGFGMDEPSLG